MIDFYGKVIIEPTTVEHNAGALKAVVELSQKKRRGLVSIGELSIPLLIRMGAYTESTETDNRAEDSKKKTGDASDNRIKSNTSEAHCSH